MLGVYAILELQGQQELLILVNLRYCFVCRRNYNNSTASSIANHFFINAIIKIQTVQSTTKGLQPWPLTNQASLAR